VSTKRELPGVNLCEMCSGVALGDVFGLPGL